MQVFHVPFTLHKQWNKKGRMKEVGIKDLTRAPKLANGNLKFTGTKKMQLDCSDLPVHAKETCNADYKTAQRLAFCC